MLIWCVVFFSPVTRIKKETGVSIRIPSDEEKSSQIRIEGSPEGIQQAKKELLEIAQRLVSQIIPVRTGPIKQSILLTTLFIIVYYMSDS